MPGTFRNPDASLATVEAQLQRMTASGIFVNSPRMMRFLRVIVTKAMSGQAESLSEHALAVEVFDKHSSFDPRANPLVRVEARRLRRKLKQYYALDGRDDRIWIEMPPGTYIPTIIVNDGGSAQTRETGVGALAPGVRTIAVLPLTCIGGDENTRHFCDGITEELIHQFSKTLRVRVVPKRTALLMRDHQDFSEIGRRLSVQLVFEGTVRADGSRLRLHVRLVSAPDGFTVWSQSYQRPARDLIATEEELSRAIVSDLRART